MENLSHALVGMALGEVLHRRLKPEEDEKRQRTRRKVLLVTSLLAGNFPDLDIVLSPLAPAPLGYLLHHRGHTHTFALLIPQALVLWGLVALFWPNARKLLKSSSQSLKGFLLALILNFSLHIGLDSLNSYGVHPFYPISGQWFFGDMVFIVEPLFWLVFGGALCSLIPKPLLRRFLFVLLAAIPIVLSESGYLSFGSAFSLLLLLVLMQLFKVFSVRRKWRMNVVEFSFCAGFAWVFLLALGSYTVEGKIKRLSGQKGNGEVVDVSLTSYPSNLVCWMYTSVHLDEEYYLIKKGVVSLFPSLIPPGSCPPKLAPKEDSPIRVSLSRFRRVAKEDCFFREWLRFARVPALDYSSAWDERFTRGKANRNFTYIELELPRKCPDHLPEWIPPRESFLR